MPVDNAQREPSENEELARGPQGVQGIRGEKGDPGPAGPPGPPGPKGDRGDRGEQGDRGSAGADGERGDEGPRGGRGAEGLKGDRGERGERGERGPAGPQGESSVVPGPRGERGERGKPGPSGDIGLRGEAGPPGEPAYLTAKLEHDQSAKLDRMQDVGLSFDCVANTDYFFEFLLPFMGAPVFKLEGPPSTDLLTHRPDRGEEMMTMTGLLRSGPVGGVLSARFRPATPGAAVTILAGAMVRWHTY